MQPEPAGHGAGHGRRATLGWAALVVAGYWLAAEVAAALTFVNTSISPLWLPSGIALAAVLRGGPRFAPAVWLGAFCFNATTPVGPWLAAVIAAGSTGEALLGAALLHRVGFRDSLERVRDVAAMSVLGAAVAAAVSATVGVSALRLAGLVPGHEVASSWTLWWFGDAVGVLTVAPVLLALLRPLRRPHPARLLEAAALAVALPLVTGLSLVAHVIAPLLVFPVLVWASMRFRQLGASLACLLVAAVAAGATATGRGPFAAPSLVEGLLLTQGFVAAAVATALLLAALTLERERISRALRRARGEIEVRDAELDRERTQLAEAQRVAGLGSWEGEVETLTGRWSRELFRILGLPPVDGPVHFQLYLDSVHEQDRPPVEAQQRRLLAGSPVAFEHRVVLPDGQVRTVAVRGEPVRDQAGTVRRVVGTALDVTERKQAEEALLREQHRTRSIINTASSPFVGIDSRGVITDWNQSAERVFGWTAEEAIGASLADLLVPPRFRDAHQSGLERVRSTGRSMMLGKRLELASLHRDGHEIPVELAVWEVHGGSGRSFNAFLHDITERKEIERALATAHQEASAASQLKSQFLAVMSHEIRTPMNGVMGLTQLLLDSDLDATQQDYAEGIRAAGDALLGVINDILDFSQIEAGNLVLAEEPFDLAALVRQVSDRLAGPARDKGLRLVASCPPGVPPLCGDPARVRQVLLNLGSNAVKFTERGDVSIQVSVDGSATQGRVGVRIEVSDTGIGVPSERRARLFEPFVQADGSTTREHGGTGLGLAISRRLAEAMGGEIGMRARDGRGSVFWCVLPLRRARLHDPGAPAAVPDPARTRSAGSSPGDAGDAGPIPAASPAVEGTGAPPVRARAATGEAPTGPAPAHVLLVEDNKINQMVSQAFLTELGYTVDIANNGLEAVTMAGARPYRAILMDCQMPVMDGYAATVELRALEGQTRHTPIIALTAAALPHDRQRCLAAGMDDYLAKPIKLHDLGDVLARWITDPSVGSDAGPPVAEAPPEHEPLDRKRLDDLAGAAEPGLLKRLAGQFLEGAPATLAALDEAVGRGDSEAVLRVSQSLRSEAVMLGATAMAGLCEALEVLGRARCLDPAADIVTRLHAELALVRRALDNYRADLPAHH
jgi:PAS domain S-box-containing protein